MYSRTIGEKTYTFGHEGVLYRRSFIMYDKQTDSLWIHTTGEAVKGPMKGKVLTFLPSTVTSWKRWKALHPETTVLTGQRGSRQMGHFGFGDRPKDYGLSVGQGPAPKLYPFAILMEARVVNDECGGKPVVVLFDSDSKTAKAYERGEHTFAWKDGALVDETGAAWDMLRGAPSEGKERLVEMPSTPWLIERWNGFHPRGAVYRE